MHVGFSFSAVLTISGEGSGQQAQLSISEMTSFRQISHLTLKMSAVNEATLRKYLAEQVKRYRQELAGQRMPLEQQQPPRMAQAPPPMDTFNITERLKILTERCSLLETQNNQLHQHKSSQENEIALLNGQLHASYEETRRLRNELLGISPQPMQTAQNAPHIPVASGSIVNGLNAQIAGLEALVKEKNSELIRLNELYESTREGKKQAEDALSRLQGQLGQLEATNRQSMADITKANEIIRKLQEELRSAKSRMRTAEALVKQHERMAQDTSTSYQAARTEVHELREQLAQRSKDLADLTTAKHALEVDLEETRKLVEGHEKVIAWMHKEINESHLDRIVSKAKVEEQFQKTTTGHHRSYSPPPTMMDQRSSNPSSIPTMPMRLSPEDLAGKAKEVYNS